MKINSAIIIALSSKPLSITIIVISLISIAVLIGFYYIFTKQENVTRI